MEIYNTFFSYFRHNDLPWNIRKFVKNRLEVFRFDADLRDQEPWARSSWSHTDLKRLREGMVSAQVSPSSIALKLDFHDNKSIEVVFSRREQ